jgi:hypothetical protein
MLLLQQCNPTMALVHGVTTMCSNNDLSSYCCKNVLQQWMTLVPTVATMLQQWPVYIVAMMCFNNDLGSQCCTNVFQQWPLFILLQQCAPAMTLGHAGGLVSRKNVTDRQTDRHGQAHKVFFAHARACRTPKNCKIIKDFIREEELDLTEASISPHPVTYSCLNCNKHSIFPNFSLFKQLW